ncbi:gp6-like head-tail connector protein [Mycoplasmopsis mustelae]|uniref:Gp6-like head-tail connector protein n=1 Tax=Mycoplasmopsis mustelae TaxID=171289 RepID=A0A4R7UC35_9BACT|nr:phage head-tail connector protein [Mycoplasmopsis mustelae]TDV23501.1 gp6-like head-tail connector protein [Mycoplasmopsis mustelae]
MWPNEVIYDWLQQLKQNLAIADDSRDDLLLDYIEIARENIWKQYYELETDENGIPDEHPWSWDLKTKLATLHLAALYVSNPDTNNIANSVIDSRMIFKILGDRIPYGKN